MEKIKNLHEKAKEKKKEYKKKLTNIINQQEENNKKYEREIIYLKQKIFSEKNESSTQTDIDSLLILQMENNHKLVSYHFKLVKL